jgi:EmrB/QacA subfamily drug resistance transporter
VVAELNTARVAIRPAVLAGALVALFTASVTNTIIGIALPTIAGDLGGQDQVAWVASAALLTMTAATPVWGKAADRRGPRPLLLGAIAVFVAGSLVAGAATAMAWLVIGRAVQGIGAGGILALVNALIAVLVPARERGRYTAWFGAAFGVASVGGPLFGGVLVAAPGLGWRWCFLGVVPVAALAAVLVRRAPHHPPQRRAVPADHLGAVLVAATVAGLVLLLSAAGTAWPWASPETAALGLVVALAAATVLRARRAADPVLPPRLLRVRTFALACVTSVLMGAVMFGAVVYLPQYLQVVRGHGPAGAGLLMLPLVGAMIVTTALVGRAIVHTGRWKVFPAVGCGLMVAGSALLAGLDPATPPAQLATAMALLGTGIGMTQQVLVLIAQDSAGPEDLGVAGSAATSTRMLGGALGVAAFGALIAGRLRSDLPAVLAAAGLPTDAGAVRRLLGTPAEIAALPTELADAVRTSFAAALQTVFLACVPIAALALLAVLLTRETALGTR